MVSEKPTPDKLQQIHSLLTQDFSDVPADYDTFKQSVLSSPERQRQLHKLLSDNYSDIPTFDRFSTAIGAGSTPAQPAGSETPAPEQDLESQLLAGQKEQAQPDLTPATMEQRRMAIQEELPQSQSAIEVAKTYEKEVADFAREKTKDKFADMTFLQKANNIAGSFNRGAFEVAPALLESIATGANAIDEYLPFNDEARKKEVKDYATYKGAQWLRKTFDELFPINKEYEQEFVSQVAGGLGQIVPMILAAPRSAAGLVAEAPAAGNALVQAGKELAKAMGSRPALIGSVQVGSGEFKQAKEAGASDEVAFEAYLKNAVVGGVMEQLPVALALKRFNAATKGGLIGWLSGAAVGGTEEMITEVAQEVYSNINAKNSYDKTREIFEGVQQSGEVGYSVGFILNALLGGVKTRKKVAKSADELAELQKAEDYIKEKLAENNDVSPTPMADVVKAEMQAETKAESVQERKEQLKELLSEAKAGLQGLIEENPDDNQFFKDRLELLEKDPIQFFQTATQTDVTEVALDLLGAPIQETVDNSAQVAVEPMRPSNVAEDNLVNDRLTETTTENVPQNSAESLPGQQTEELQPDAGVRGTEQPQLPEDAPETQIEETEQTQDVAESTEIPQEIPQTSAETAPVAQNQPVESTESPQDDLERFRQGRTIADVLPEEKISERDINEVIATYSENPAEIAQAYLNTPEESREASNKMQIIAEGIVRFPAESYKRFSDNNLLKGQGQIKLNYFAGKNYTGAKATIDQQAQQLSEASGVEITPQDIVDFVNAYPSGRKTYRPKNETRERLKKRFSDLTGTELTPELAESLNPREQLSLDMEGVGDSPEEILAYLQSNPQLQQLIEDVTDSEGNIDFTKFELMIDENPMDFFTEFPFSLSEQEYNTLTTTIRERQQRIRAREAAEILGASETTSGRPAKASQRVPQPQKPDQGRKAAQKEVVAPPPAAEPVDSELQQRLAPILEKRQSILDRMAKKRRGEQLSNFGDMLGDYVELGLTYIEEGAVRGLVSFKKFKAQLKADVKESTGVDLSDEEAETVYDAVVAAQGRSSEPVSTSPVQQSDKQSDAEAQEKERGISRLYRTSDNSEAILKEELEQNKLTYREYTHKRALDEATTVFNRLMAEGGLAKVQAYSLSSDPDNLVIQQVVRMLFVGSASRQAAKLREAGDAQGSRDLMDAIAEVMDKQGEQETKTGQANSVKAMWHMLTPEGALYVAQKAVRKYENTSKGQEKKETAKKTAKKVVTELNKVTKKAAAEVAAQLDKKPPTERKPRKSYGSENKIVTKAAYKQSVSKIKDFFSGRYKSGAAQASLIGLPADVVEALTKAAAFHLEAGTRTFSDFAGRMVKDAGTRIIPYLKDLYREGAKRSSIPATDLTPDADVTKEMESLVDSSVSKEKMDTLIRKAAREEGKTMGDLVREHYEGGNTATTLKDKILENFELSAEEATSLAQRIENQIARLTAREKLKITQRYIKGKKDKALGKDRKTTPEPKTLPQRIVEASQSGILTEKDVMDLEGFGLAFGLPEMNDTVAGEILRLAGEVQKAPQGFLRQEKVDAMLRYIAKQYGINKWNNFWAIYYPAILSGFSTQLLNIGSANIALTTEILSVIARNPSELATAWKASNIGRSKGVTVARLTMRDGAGLKTREQEILAGKGLGSQDILENNPKGIMKAYEYLKYVSRTMTAADQIVNTGAYYMELGGLLRDKYQNEGLRGQELDRAVMDALHGTEAEQQAAKLQAESEFAEIGEQAYAGGKPTLKFKRRVAEIINQKISADMREEAVKFAKRTNFTETPKGTIGIGARFINSLIGEVPGLRIAIPFVNIIGNVVNRQIDYTVLGYLRANGYSITGQKNYKDAEEKYSKSSQWGPKGSRAYSQQISNAHTGAIITMLAAALFLADDEEDSLFDITGAQMADGYEASKEKQKMRPNHSIKLFGFWIPYNQTPFNLTFATLGNIKDYKRSKKGSDANLEKMATVAMTTAASSMLNTGYTESLITMFRDMQVINEKGVSADRLKQMMAKKAVGVVTPVIPVLGTNMWKQTVGVFDPTKYEQKEIDQMFYRATALSGFMSVNPEVDVWGDKVEAYPAETYIPTSYYLGKKDPDKVEKFLIEKNLYFTKPTRFPVVVTGYDAEDNEVVREMKPEEKHRFIVLRGKAIKHQLQQLIDSGEHKQMTDEELKSYKTSITRQATEYASFAIEAKQLGERVDPIAVWFSEE